MTDADGWRAAAAAAALLLAGACAGMDGDDQMAGGSAMTDEALCAAGIAQVEAGLAQGLADANARREAEGELDEALEEQEDGNFAACVTDLSEALEELGLEFEGAAGP